MKFFTHLAFGFLVGLYAIDFFNISQELLFMFFVLVSSIFADIDHPDSKLGRWFKPLGWLFSHRGFFHSLLAVALFAILAYLAWGNQLIIIAILVGYSSHLILDALNHQGIAFLFPLKKLKLKGFLKSGGIADYIMLGVFITLGFLKLTNNIF